MLRRLCSLHFQFFGTVEILQNNIKIITDIYLIVYCKYVDAKMFIYYDHVNS